MSVLNLHLDTCKSVSYLNCFLGDMEFFGLFCTVKIVKLLSFLFAADAWMDIAKYRLLDTEQSVLMSLAHLSHYQKCEVDRVQALYTA